MPFYLYIAYAFLVIAGMLLGLSAGFIAYDAARYFAFRLGIRGKRFKFAPVAGDQVDPATQ